MSNAHIYSLAGVQHAGPEPPGPPARAAQTERPREALYCVHCGHVMFINALAM